MEEGAGGGIEAVVPPEGVAGTLVGDIVCAVVHRQVEGDDAVAADGVGGCTSGTSRISVTSPVPFEAVAGGGDGVARGGMVDGEVEGHHAVAAEDRTGCTSGTSATSVTGIAPLEVVAGHGDGVAGGGVVDGETEGVVDGQPVYPSHAGIDARSRVGAVTPGVALARCNGGVVGDEVVGQVVDGEIVEEYLSVTGSCRVEGNIGTRSLVGAQVDAIFCPCGMIIHHSGATTDIDGVDRHKRRSVALHHTYLQQAMGGSV